jgi:hypothetical protein
VVAGCLPKFVLTALPKMKVSQGIQREHRHRCEHKNRYRQMESPGQSECHEFRRALLPKMKAQEP